MAKRVIKIDVKWAEAMIEQLRILNRWKAGEANFIQLFGVSKQEAFENIINGIESTVKRAKEPQP